MIVFKLDKIVSCRVLIASNQERGKVFSEQMRSLSRFLKGSVNLAALLYSILFEFLGDFSFLVPLWFNRLLAYSAQKNKT